MYSQTGIKKVLLIGGSMNQNRIVREIGRHLEGPDIECVYSPFYTDDWTRFLLRLGLLETTVLGSRHRQRALDYFRAQGLRLRPCSSHERFDLAVITSDLIIPRDIRSIPIILAQEGMTDPETLMLQLVKAMHLPRWLASTASMGMSNAYRRFCVASEGYRDHFITKGVDPKKIVVTGIPTFDAANRFRNNSFPFHGYVLAATSDARETWKIDRRRRFLREVKRIAGARPVIVKLHPNENRKRAEREIGKIIPGAAVFQDGSVEEIIANCDELITQYSTVVYIGLVLGKKSHSYFDIEQLKRLIPVQNGGRSGHAIAEVCREVLFASPQACLAEAPQVSLERLSEPSA